MSGTSIIAKFSMSLTHCDDLVPVDTYKTPGGVCCCPFERGGSVFAD